MKPFIGIDITENKKNDKINGKEFVVQETSKALYEAYDKATDEVGVFHKKAAMPLWFRIIHKIIGVGALIVSTSIVKIVLNKDGIETFVKVLKEMPWFVLLGVVCWAIFGVMTIIGRKKIKTVAESDEYNHTQSKAESLSNSVYAELGVPPQAPFVDILSFQYKIKDGKLKPKGKDAKTVPFINIAFKIHSDGENLYLTEMENKYAFAFSEMKGIKIIKERGFVQAWNKDEDFNKGEYKQYKITKNDYGYYFKHYCILELEHNCELWEIYFPDYELPIFEQVTGIKAE